MSRPRGDLVLTSELDHLQRKYRSMELARRDLHDDNSNTLRMQRAQIEKLKKDHERIKEELALETRQAKLSNNMSATHSIAKLQDQGDIYQRKIEIEKRKIAEFSAAMSKMDTAIFDSRKQSGGFNAARETNLSANKQIRIFENRLDKALVKFNEALAHNKQLRETIDNLRRERVVFDGIYRKLERELGEKKEKMASIIDISHAAYEARGQAQSEMFALKANADEQQGRFEHEWDALGELIQKDQAMKEMLSQKEQERSYALTHGLNHIASTSSDANGRGEGQSLTPVDPHAEAEYRLRQKVKKAKNSIRRDRQTIAQNQAKVASYEENFAKIQSATNIIDIEELVGVFVAAEDENFKLFNFVNSLNHEIEREEDAIQALQASIQAYTKSENQQSNDNQRKLILATIEQQMSQTKSQTHSFEQSSQFMQETLGQLKNSIETLIEQLGVPQELITEMFGGGGVTELNLGEYLGLIEERANQVIDQYQKIVKETGTKAITDASNDGDDNEAEDDNEDENDDDNGTTDGADQDVEADNSSNAAAGGESSEPQDGEESKQQLD